MTGIKITVTVQLLHNMFKAGELPHFFIIYRYNYVSLQIHTRTCNMITKKKNKRNRIVRSYQDTLLLEIHLHPTVAPVMLLRDYVT